MKSNTTMPMVLIGILFFIFGFVTWLNGSLIPYLKVLCDLSDTQALLVTFAFYIAYTTMAYPMSFILNKHGYKNSMAFGLAIMAFGSLLFIPAAFSASYPVFLLALFTLGSGLTILQTASNPYIVLLGPNESAAMRISIMGLLNKGAGILAPIVFTALVLSDIELTSVNAESLVLPYFIMAIILILLIVLIKYSSLPEIEFEDVEDVKDSIFMYPRVILGVVALFFYVGVEVIAGDTIGLYAKSLGLDSYTTFTSYTMSFMVLGYIIGVVAIPKYISQKNALLYSGLLGIISVIMVSISSTNTYTITSLMPDSIFFVALLGLANALVWPSIWPLALKDLGSLTPQASALLIMAIAGGAIMPLIFGLVSEKTGLQDAYLITILAYIFIIYYALKGHEKIYW